MSKQEAQSVKLFQDLRQDVLMAHEDIDAARDQAFKAFQETGEQTALTFIARILLTKATQNQKGSLFKKVDEFLRKCDDLTTKAGKELKEELVVCRVELIIDWLLNQNKGPVYWEQFEQDLSRILSNSRYAKDTLWLFYFGVAQYNQGKFVDAEACFQTLRSRRLPWDVRQEIRCLYLGDAAEPKILEGTLSHGVADKRFVYSASLENDILVHRGDLPGRVDEVKHFKIGFSLNGPIAIDRDRLR